MTTEQRRMQAARLRAEREKRGWGQRTLARRLRDAVEDQQKPELPSFVTYVKRWETGKAVVSDSRYRAAYAAVFGIDQEELFNETTSPGSVDVGVIPEDAGDDMRRRAALQLLAALGAGAAIPPAVFETALAGIEDALGNPLDLDEWERTAHEYGQLLTVRPAGALTRDLTADLLAIGELLTRQMPDTDRQRMLRVSAALSACLAIDLGGTGDLRATRATWATAKRAADASGDTTLRVWVRGRAAQEACWTGRPAETITALANEGIALAAGTPSPGLARAQAARAYAAATQGDTAQARVFLAAAEQTFDHLPNADERRTIFAFLESHLWWSKSYVHVLTADDRARETVAGALSLYPTEAHGARSNLALMDAIALIHAREVEAGLQQALTVLEKYPDATTSGRKVLLGQVLQTLPEQARELPSARELRALASVGNPLDVPQGTR